MQTIPCLHVLMATGVVLFHDPCQSSPNCPWPILRIQLREALGISHGSLRCHATASRHGIMCSCGSLYCLTICKQINFFTDFIKTLNTYKSMVKKNLQNLILFFLTSHCNYYEFNKTVNNISALLWHSAFLVDKTGLQI